MNLMGAIFTQSTTLPKSSRVAGVLLHAEGCHPSLTPRNSVPNTIRTRNDPVLQASSESFLSRGSLGTTISKEKRGAMAVSGDGWRCFFVKSADHYGEQGGPGGT